MLSVPASPSHKTVNPFNQDKQTELKSSHETIAQTVHTASQTIFLDKATQTESDSNTIPSNSPVVSVLSTIQSLSLNKSILDENLRAYANARSIQSGVISKL